MGKTWLEIRTELDGAINDAREFVAAMEQDVIRLEKQKAGLRAEILSLAPVADSTVDRGAGRAPDSALGNALCRVVSRRASGEFCRKDKFRAGKVPEHAKSGGAVSSLRVHGQRGLEEQASLRNRFTQGS